MDYYYTSVTIRQQHVQFTIALFIYTYLLPNDINDYLLNHFDCKTGDKCSADFQKMREKKAYETVYGDNNYVGYVFIYLLLSDFLWTALLVLLALRIRLWYTEVYIFLSHR